MKAKVIAKANIDGKPTKIGDIVDVDENTFRNLVKKGMLEPASKEAEAVDIEAPSQLDAADVKANIAKQDAAKK